MKWFNFSKKKSSPENNDDDFIKFDIHPENIHKTKSVLINGEYRDIDENISDLVSLLNKVGLKTVCSCEGDIQNKAYITFSFNDILYYEIDKPKNEFTISWRRTK